MQLIGFSIGARIERKTSLAALVPIYAAVAQLVEHQTSNLRVAGSRPVRRSTRRLVGRFMVFLLTIKRLQRAANRWNG